jgi:hypothetical protein
MLLLVGTLRSHLPRIVGIWLVCQASVLAAAPLSMAGVFFVDAGEHALMCTCGTAGPDHDCPVHGKHASHTVPAQSAPDCAMRSGNSIPEATLASLFAGIGLVPTALTQMTAEIPTESVPALFTPVLLRSERPDSPPPRPRAR